MAMVMVIAQAHAGHKEEAMDLLVELMEIPSGTTVDLLKIDPFFDPLRDNPRFRALIAKGHKVF